MDKKLGIIVPYRNRKEHLEIFKNEMSNFLDRRKYNYEIIIVNQDGAKLFNRGMLLNIGFKIAQELNCDYVVFHDVDMIPHRADYSYSDIPLHLATNFMKLNDDKKNQEFFDEYFGGVTLFPMEHFIKIDGYSNKYWGWGYEDTDLLHRCRKHNIELDTMIVKNSGITSKALKFNGFDAFVRGKRNFNLNNNITFFISFYPDEMAFDHKKRNDDFTVFSLPGYDTSISYNSFLRYNFCTFEEETKEALYINSKIKPRYKTNICVKINVTEKYLDVFQDGFKIGTISNFKKLIKPKDPFFYLGAGNPNRTIDQKFFKGYIDRFMIFDNDLTDDEILNLSREDKYDVSFLKLYYDANHLEGYNLKDLSGNNNNGKIHKCEIVDVNFNKFEKIKIPHRRDSVFKLLKHDENGFMGNTWKDETTRWNQLRYNNEVLKDDNLIYNDGLSTLEYYEYGRTVENKITHINVAI